MYVCVCMSVWVGVCESVHVAESSKREAASLYVSVSLCVCYEERERGSHSHEKSGKSTVKKRIEMRLEASCESLPTRKISVPRIICGGGAVGRNTTNER